MAVEANRTKDVAGPGQSLHLNGGVVPVATVLLESGQDASSTVRLIKHLRACLLGLECEFLVIRSADCDGDLAEVMQSTEVQFFPNPSGFSYAGACNEAAAVARGAILVLLGDAQLENFEGLDRAIELFARRASCGAVGGAVLRPDGRLAHAGCIMASDGSGSPWGEGDLPGAPAYQYDREVDYCTGPLLVRTAQFQQVGGFDTRYAGMDHATADLSFRLRDVGLRTWFCPAFRARLSEDAGMEGAAFRSTAKTGDAATFRKVWRPVLERRHFRPGMCAFRAREHAMHRRVVLVMDHTLPQPERDAGSNALLHTMRELCRMGFLVKFWPDDQLYDPRFAAPLEREGIEIVVQPGGNSAFETYISRRDVTFDFALLCRPNFAGPYVSVLRRLSDARILFFGHDLHGQRMMAQALVTGDAEDAVDARKMFESELALWRAADAVIYPSEEEAEIASAHVGRGKVHVVPLYVLEGDESQPSRDLVDANKLIFVACFGHPPNEDAAQWLVESIWPLVRARLPDMKLYLVGSMPTPRVRALASNEVHVTGEVSAAELDRYYREAAVAITPMRFGGGVKLKVVEAMSRGVPLVTTPVGVQGLANLSGCVEVAEEAASMADAVIALATNQARATEMTASARAYVRNAYSGARMQRALWRAFAAWQAPP